MDFLLDIPVLGFILQFLVYLVNVIVNGHIAPIVLGLSAPIALGALCGIMNERSGVVNIGIEGMMLSGAFAGFLAAGLFQQTFGGEGWGPFGITPALLVGVIAAILTAMALSA